MQTPLSLALAAPVSNDLRSAWFGDARLTTRLCRVADALSAQPSASFPIACSTTAELEGAYRFMNNPRVTSDEILAAHHEATAGRARGCEGVLLLHDTTEMRFSGTARRDGLGPLHGSDQGFLAHATLAVTADAERAPLGVLALSTWTRSASTGGKRRAGPAGRRGEFLRWESQALEAEARLPPEAQAIHVMDREADSYSLFHALSQSRYVIRVQHDREILSAIDGEQQSIRDAAKEAPILLEREVQLSRRQNPRRKKTATKKMHPPREARTARLAISACAVILRRTKKMPRDTPTHQVVNVVRVAEVDAPPDVVPVEWLLVTNLAADTPEQLAAIVDCYRARWLIEEFFKALKSGCRVEERQLESLHALLNAMAIVVPIAWQMLALRTLERAAPNAPASRVLTPPQLDLLRALPTTRLPKSPTVRDALLVIARMGGHLRHNGAPGWQTLAIGFSQLRLLELGWAAATRKRM
jgi:hypothetical protein